MKATILIPTFNHGPTLNYSIPSVLNQTIKDIEILVVGDGVPIITRRIIKKFQKQDKRIKFFDNPKGPRHGEIYRNEALKQADGKIICYLSDDDLWLPNHIETMLKLLTKHNFAHALPFFINTNGKPQTSPGNVALPKWRQRILSGKNFISLSCAGHTRSLYTKLAEKWNTTPEGIATDIYMWQKFLRHPDCKPISGTLPTTLLFPSPQRKYWFTRERLNELDRWSKKMTKANFQRTLTNQLEDVSLNEKDHASRNARYKQDYPTRKVLWEITHLLRGLRYLRP